MVGGLRGSQNHVAFGGVTWTVHLEHSHHKKRVSGGDGGNETLWGSLPKVCKHQSPETNILLWTTIPTKKKVKQQRSAGQRTDGTHLPCPGWPCRAPEDVPVLYSERGGPAVAGQPRGTFCLSCGAFHPFWNFLGAACCFCAGRSPGRASPRRCQGETPPPFFFPEDLGRKGAPGWVGRGPQGDCGLGLPGLGRTPRPGRLAGGLHLGRHSPGALSLCCVHFQMLRSRDFHSGHQLCPPGPGSTLSAESWGLSPGPAQVDHPWDPGQRQ